MCYLHCVDGRVKSAMLVVLVYMMTFLLLIAGIMRVTATVLMTPAAAFLFDDGAGRGDANGYVVHWLYFDAHPPNCLLCYGYDHGWWRACYPQQFERCFGH